MSSDPKSINIGTAGGPKYHWWYDANKAGVRNPPPPNYSGSPPTSPTSSSPNMSSSPTYNPLRRDSLKNLFHMSDFGTPDN